MKKKLAKKLGIVPPRDPNYRDMVVANKAHIFKDKRYKKPRYKEDYSNWE